MLSRAVWILDKVLAALLLAILITGDVPQLAEATDRIRTFTRAVEFDYPTWMWNAAWMKIEQAVIGAPNSFDHSNSKQIVTEYFRTTQQILQIEARIEQLFADPNVQDKEAATANLRTQRDQLRAYQAELAPFTESILQSQVAETFAEQGLSTGGQTLPPLLYHITETPLALIVSPRDRIEQITSVSLLPSLTLDEQIKIEDDTAKAGNVSTLIVPVGGIGVYPTMVEETADLHWTLNTIAHEWTHNYLNLRPLGLHYSTLRTMNETTASISGDEVGNLVIKKYYPELLASSSTLNLIQFQNPFQPLVPLADTTPFDFRAEMHETRVNVDKLLAEGKIDEAESYMEQRRQVFWKNGYLIRKLNQAYFAFNGAYADVPGGAAGEDPVGPAVRALRAQSKTLADFINSIAWMTSFQQLQQAIHK